MELWLVRDVPAWLVGVLLVLGLPLAMLALDALIHRQMPHRRLGRHNTVTGVIVSVVGVAYAIVIGLCVVSLWNGFSDAEHTCLLYTSPSPRDRTRSRMPSSA